MVKQVIVVNMKVPFPIGRLDAQSCHACGNAILSMGRWLNKSTFIIDGVKPEIRKWMDEEPTKVVCKEWGRDALMALYTEAKAKGLPCGMEEDDGFLTAIAIGPTFNMDIDPITKDLSLL